MALALLRICVGILFLIFGQYKVFGTQFTLHGGFQFWIHRFLQEGALLAVLRRFSGPFRSGTLLFGFSDWPGRHRLVRATVAEESPQALTYFIY